MTKEMLQDRAAFTERCLLVLSSVDTNNLKGQGAATVRAVVAALDREYNIAA